MTVLDIVLTSLKLIGDLIELAAKKDEATAEEVEASRLRALAWAKAVQVDLESLSAREQARLDAEVPPDGGE